MCYLVIVCITVSDSIYCIVGVAVLKQQSGYRPVFALCVCDWGRARGEGERRERRERDGERERDRMIERSCSAAGLREPIDSYVGSNILVASQ